MTPRAPSASSLGLSSDARATEPMLPPTRARKERRLRSWMAGFMVFFRHRVVQATPLGVRVDYSGRTLLPVRMLKAFWVCHAFADPFQRLKPSVARRKHACLQGPHAF